MNDRFKFRAWNKEQKVMQEVDMEDNEVFPNPDLYIPMQCTGLRDKNSKLIYEGDVIKYKFPIYAYDNSLKKIDYDFENAYVVWRPEFCSFELELSQTEEQLDYESANTCYEVIGNIYENPELIK